MIGEATDEGLSVSGRESEQRLEAKIDAFPNGEVEFHEFLKATGQTVSDVMFKATVEIVLSRLRQRLMRSERSITSARIAEYYYQHERRFLAAEERQVEIVSTKREDTAERIKREVESGKNLSSQPEQESLVYTRGLLHEGHENMLEKAIFAARPDVPIGPVGVERNLFVFEVRQVTPPRQLTLVQVRGSIEQQLAAEQHMRVLAAFIKAWREKWIAKTSCEPGFIVQQCRQYRASTGSIPEDPFVSD